MQDYQGSNAHGDSSGNESDEEADNNNLPSMGTHWLGRFQQAIEGKQEGKIPRNEMIVQSLLKLAPGVWLYGSEEAANKAAGNKLALLGAVFNNSEGLIQS